MYITALSDEISTDFEMQLKILKENDLRFIDLRDINGRNILEFSDSEIKYIKEKLLKSEITVSCISTRIGKEHFPNKTTQMYEIFSDLKKAISIAKKLDSNFVRIFSFYYEDVNYVEGNILNLLNKLNDLAKLNKITLLVENEPGTYTDNIENIFGIFDKIQSDNLRLLWDTGNFAEMGNNPYTREYLLVLSLIKYIHIKDIKIATKEKVFPGDGDCGIQQFITDITHKNYKGFVCLEPLVIYNKKYSNVYSKEELFSRSVESFSQILKSFNEN
uniref:sugar phosphate isomerase/epimerase family protein n=1 Tax=Bacillus sp. DX2.2 TaxID=3073452 RepID=UPI00402AF009